MSLVKLVSDHTWNQAGLELGLPEGIGKHIGNAGIASLNRTGNADIFGSRLHDLAGRLARRPHLTDYGFRRIALADLDDIDPIEWTKICRSAGMRRGRVGRRSGAASAWLWCHLTRGRRRLAPWFLLNPDGISSDLYLRFEREALEELKDGLLAYGNRLLNNRS